MLLIIFTVLLYFYFVMSIENPLIWILCEKGLTGTENQCRAVADAYMEMFPKSAQPPIIHIKRIKLRWPWTFLSPFIRFFDGPHMLAADSDSILPDQTDHLRWPDILICAGRKAVAPALWIKRASGGKTFLCVLQKPYISPALFDMVAAPFHDQLSGSNVIITDGAPNLITSDRLLDAHEKWGPVLSPLPAPRLAVLIGGISRTYTFTADDLDAMIARIQDWQTQYHGGVMITVSRRTPTAFINRIQDAFAGNSAIIYTGTGENPYHGFLAYADYIMVTIDSTSMISDAASTGKPIDFIPLKGGSSRSSLFLNHMKARGIGAFQKDYVRLQDAKNVATAIKDRFLKEK